jgi:hypothetical protein
MAEAIPGAARSTAVTKASEMAIRFMIQSSSIGLPENSIPMKCRRVKLRAPADGPSWRSSKHMTLRPPQLRRDTRAMPGNRR